MTQLCGSLWDRWRWPQQWSPHLLIDSVDRRFFEQGSLNYPYVGVGNTRTPVECTHRSWKFWESHHTVHGCVLQHVCRWRIWALKDVVTLSFSWYGICFNVEISKSTVIVNMFSERQHPVLWEHIHQSSCRYALPSNPIAQNLQLLSSAPHHGGLESKISSLPDLLKAKRTQLVYRHAHRRKRWPLSWRWGDVVYAFLGWHFFGWFERSNECNILSHLLRHFIGPSTFCWLNGYPQHFDGSILRVQSIWAIPMLMDVIWCCHVSAEETLRKLDGKCLKRKVGITSGQIFNKCLFGCQVYFSRELSRNTFRVLYLGCGFKHVLILWILSGKKKTFLQAYFFNWLVVWWGWKSTV